ncbi:MAG: TonB-dependent receptor [Vicinamibacteria bacterium]
MFRLFSLVPLLFAAPALAGDLTVQVRDSQDAGIPRAEVKLTRRDASWRTAAVTDENGVHRFPALAPGSYLLSASARGFAAKVITVRVEGSDPSEVFLRLEIAAIEESIVVVGADSAQTLSEITKSLSVVSAEEMESRDEYYVPEALRTVPGVRVEQLGGPGAFTSLKIRGLRTEDTAILVDGARLRDPSAPQGDASSFIENLVTPELDRVEILRGSGSSLHGTNAGGGVINIVTAPGGGEPRGSVLFEGGGLGFLRAGVETAGGFRDRLLYSIGASHVNVTKGVDGDDEARNTSIQGRALFQISPRSSLSFRFYGSDARLALNESPVTLGSLPEGEIRAIPLADEDLRRYESGAPLGELEIGNANYVPSADDPDNRRDTSFYSTLLTYEQKPNADFSYSLRYHGLFTSRRFDEGPLGTSPFEPPPGAADIFDGNIQTFAARADYDWGARQILHAGYELEREAFENRTLAEAFQEGPLTDVSQSSHTFYIQDQGTLLDGALSISASARAQLFSLDEARFEPEEGAPFQGIDFASPDDAVTVDLSAAYGFRERGTRLRAHFGTGYRAPSLFERFGASFSSFGYSVFGDPRLSPERTRTFDLGIEQIAFSGRARMEATYFRTRLSEIIVFDFSGAIDPATDPFGRFGGYLSADGGVTQGLELVAAIAPRRGLDLKASYTYTDAEPPRGVTPTLSQAFVIPRHQFSLVATRSFGSRLSLSFDFLASSTYLAPVFDLSTFSSRTYRFDGFVEADLVASYRLPAGSGGLRLFAKIENLFDETVHASGFRTPGRYGLVGVSYGF